MTPARVMRLGYGLAAFVLLSGLVLFFVTDRSVFLIFAAIGAFTALAGYLSFRGPSSGTGSDVE